MYYAAKLLEAVGLSLIAYGFLQNFPKLMNFKVFAAGVVFFLAGLCIEKFVLKGDK